MSLHDAFKFVNTAQIYPPLYATAQQVLADCRREGAEFYASSGFRTWAEQNALFDKGGVTRARGGESLHNYGLALDFTRDQYVDRAGLQPDWNLDHYEVLARCAAKRGLEAAFYWPTFKEGPHVQVDIRSRGLSVRLLANVWRRYKTDAEALRAVWDLMDERARAMVG